jgi:hypothetical protein
MVSSSRPDTQSHLHATNTATTTSESATAFSSEEKTANVAITDQRALIPQHDKLLIFRALTGIDTVPTLTRNGHSVRTAPNLGIYTRVIQAEHDCGWKHRVLTLLISSCLGVQLVVAAILTALGAADGPHSAVTAFGVINTIMAGILTYVNGSSIPDQLKQRYEGWRMVREYIEQREREFCLVDCPLDAYEEVRLVEEMYENVKSGVENGGDVGGQAERAHNGKTASQVAQPRPAYSPSTSFRRPQPRQPLSSSRSMDIRPERVAEDSRNIHVDSGHRGDDPSRMV